MPFYPGFCGTANASQSVVVNGEQCMNWYPEAVQASAAPTGMALFPTPGRRAWGADVADIGTRAFFDNGDRVFAVIGSGFYELFATKTKTKRGTVAEDIYPATISSLGLVGQLFITSGTNGYHYDLATNTLTQVLTNAATMGGAKDGRFLAFDLTTGKVRLSGLNDGLTWDLSLYIQRSTASDPWQAMVVSNPYVWMIGRDTGEALYDSGAFPQPYAPVLSSFFNYGTRAGFSVASGGGYLLWVGHTKEGSAQILGAKGFNPSVLSNYAVSTALSRLERSAGITDAETMVYQQDGHLFAVFNFTAAKATWVVDLETGAWHQRDSWNVTQNRSDAWAPRVHCHAFGTHLVGDRTTGTISELDLTAGDDLGSPIRRVRVPPPLWASSRQRVQVGRLTLHMDTGLGELSGQGMDPKAALRASMNGRTWGPERLASAGKRGDYGRRVFWPVLGSSEKLFVPEIVCTDPVPWRIAACEVDGAGFQQGRAA